MDQENSSPEPARSAFQTYWLWAAGGGAVILLLGLLLFLPVTSRPPMIAPTRGPSRP